ncbi:MAG: hypothetical protein JRI34_05455 [Deltaproteobacteria bacterium]|nr:hypothetical protein [Deltaproteobacteria bacterium]
MPVATGSYLDFEDIQIPNGFVLDRGKSYLYQTESIKTGVLSYKTSKPILEILGFFQENMPRDNWVLVSFFKYRKNIMLYNKPNKNCLIIVESLEDDSSQAIVEVWISPQGLDKEGSSLLKKVINKGGGDQ